MKHMLFFILLLVFGLTMHSQVPIKNLPSQTVVVPYTLEVGYNYNTAIAFPGKIKNAYWGYRDLMALQVPDMDNILLVKAAQRHFPPTNLHVFTGDGKMYVFNACYADSPVCTTYDMSGLNGMPTPSIIFSGNRTNDQELQLAMKRVGESPVFISKSSSRFDMHLLLKGIYFKDKLLYFKFDLLNASTLDYDVDFTKFYIRDKKKTKRSSFQQREVIPVKVDRVTAIAGKARTSFIVVIPRFTIPDKKEFLFEVYESNGGRNIALKIKNRDLLKAKRL